MGLLKSPSMWFLVVIAILAIFAINYMKQDSISGLIAQYVPEGVSLGIPALDGLAQGQTSASVMSAGQVQVFFCPEEHCADQLIAKIDDANSSIKMAIYSFTLDEIADALIRAKERGVDVKVVFDKGQSENASSEDERLAQAGIPIARRQAAGYMHNKFTVVDEAFVATGSFNYSSNADTKNDENLVFLQGEEIAKNFSEEFSELWQQATN